MLALFLAMINLSGVDPDAVKTQDVQLVKTAGATSGLGLDKPIDGLALGGDSSISICTFGAPQLGPQLWNDATALTRTFTQPQCAGDASAFGSPFGSQILGGTAGFFAAAVPWVYVRPQAPVALQASPYHASVPSALGFSAPQAVRGFVFHAPAEEFRAPAEEVAGRPVRGGARVSVQTQTVPPTRR